MIDPMTSLSFAICESRGAYALLVGSGLSTSAQIPTGWQITLDLVRRIARSQDVPEQSDWAEWYRQNHGKEPGYSEQLDAIAASPDDRRSILHSYIEPSEEEAEQGLKVPTPAHKAIANLVRSGHVRVILTTNFDRLLETALRQSGVEPTVVSSDDDLKGAVPLVHSKCYVVKLHGDYLDTRIKNTDAELSSYSRELKRLA
jgi:NAD-dependent SIR2 family protein deacetylase